MRPIDPYSYCLGLSFALFFTFGLHLWWNKQFRILTTPTWHPMDDDILERLELDFVPGITDLSIRLGLGGYWYISDCGEWVCGPFSRVDDIHAYQRLPNLVDNRDT